MQEAAGCQNKLHGLQTHGVALGWQMHGGGAHVHGDAVALLQLQCTVQERGQLRQAIAACTKCQLQQGFSEELQSAVLCPGTLYFRERHVHCPSSLLSW